MESVYGIRYTYTFQKKYPNVGTYAIYRHNIHKSYAVWISLEHMSFLSPCFFNILAIGSITSGTSTRLEGLIQCPGMVDSTSSHEGKTVVNPAVG